MCILKLTLTPLSFEKNDNEPLTDKQNMRYRRLFLSRSPYHPYTTYSTTVFVCAHTHTLTRSCYYCENNLSTRLLINNTIRLRHLWVAFAIRELWGKKKMIVAHSSISVNRQVSLKWGLDLINRQAIRHACVYRLRLFQWNHFNQFRFIKKPAKKEFWENKRKCR